MNIPESNSVQLWYNCAIVFSCPSFLYICFQGVPLSCEYFLTVLSSRPPDCLKVLQSFPLALTAFGCILNKKQSKKSFYSWRLLKEIIEKASLKALRLWSYQKLTLKLIRSSLFVSYSVFPSMFNKSLHPFPIFQIRYKEIRGGLRLLHRTVAVKTRTKLYI